MQPSREMAIECDRRATDVVHQQVDARDRPSSKSYPPNSDDRENGILSADVPVRRAPLPRFEEIKSVLSSVRAASRPKNFGDVLTRLAPERPGFRLQ